MGDVVAMTTKPPPDWSRWYDRMVRLTAEAPDAATITTEIVALHEVEADLVKTRHPASTEDPIHSLLRDLPSKEAAPAWWDVCRHLVIEIFGEEAPRLAALSVARSTYLREVMEGPPTIHVAQLAARVYLAQMAPPGVTILAETLPSDPPGMVWTSWRMGGGTSAELRAWLSDHGSRLMAQEAFDFSTALSFDRPPLVASAAWWMVLFENVAILRETPLAEILRLRAARAVYETSLRESLRRDGVEDRWGAASDAIVEWQEMGRSTGASAPTLLSALRHYHEALVTAYGYQSRVQVLLQKTGQEPSMRALLFELLEYDLGALVSRMQTILTQMTGKSKRPTDPEVEDPFVETQLPEVIVPSMPVPASSPSPVRAGPLSARDLDF